MIDSDALSAELASAGLGTWHDVLWPTIEERLSPAGHGDFGKWQAALRAADASSSPDALKSAWLELAPWRKGPFELGGVRIDAEWRSNLKWDRIATAIDFSDQSILDVGCGNGYYALQMRAAGARRVIGVDPTVLYCLQFLAVNRLARETAVFVLPLRLHELPLPSKKFDVSVSMGVLYHQRSPLDHLRQLRDTLRPGGRLLLETIFIPGDEGYACTPPDRYARMKNVWLLPTIGELTTWLGRSGYREVDIIDKSVTTPDEQRSTAWMPFESLADALDPQDPTQTVEGWPAPRRVVVSAVSR